MKKASADIPEQALEATRAELHLRHYPYFGITPTADDKWHVTYEEMGTLPNGAQIIRRWTIAAQPGTGWPGELEADVWRAIEHIIIERAKAGPVENPLKVHLSEIRRHMPGKGRGGVDLERIKEALECLKRTGIKANCFYRKEIKAEGVLSSALIPRYKLMEVLRERMVDGKLKAEKVVDHALIWIDDDILNNINLKYTRPLDKGYLDGLDKWTSKRLYEVLGPKFYGLRKKNTPYRIRYSRLCALLGNKRQQYLSYAKRILGRAHEELITTGFLHSVEWYEARPSRDPDGPFEGWKDWVLCYHPGPRAQAEWKKDFWQVDHIPQLVAHEGAAYHPEPVHTDEAPARLKSESDFMKYAGDVRAIFAEETGTRRRRWDQEDLYLLRELYKDEVPLEVIREGIARCVKSRLERKASLDPIRTLRYCEADIYEMDEGRRLMEEKGLL